MMSENKASYKGRNLHFYGATPKGEGGYFEIEQSDAGQISDGHHTFDDLYARRHALLIGWMNTLMMFKPAFEDIAKRMGGAADGLPWKSRLHADGTSIAGWFIAGMEIGDAPITYHLPLSEWGLLHAEELERAPEWDGHTSADVLERLRAPWREG